MRLSLPLAAAMLALAGCASTTDSEPGPIGIAKYADDPRLGEETNRICFASSIDSFSDNTRDTVVVREGRDHYLIEVFGTCLPLQNAITMRVAATTSCLTKGDSLIVSDSLSAGRNEPFSTARCRVKSIHKWDPKAEKAEEAPDADQAGTEVAPEES